MSKFLTITTAKPASLFTMIKMQAEVNDVFCPDWLDKGIQGNPYFRASWMEGAEACDHFGYKWWKPLNPDMPQVQLELVDIWHFILSEVMVEVHEKFDPPSREDLIHLSHEWIRRELELSDLSHDKENFIDAVEDFVYFTLHNKRRGMKACSPIQIFETLCDLAELSYDELFLQYIGKNVLNFFRQINGDKTGDYIKEDWDGQQDNFWLERVLGECRRVSMTPEDMPNYVHGRLTTLYREKALGEPAL